LKEFSAEVLKVISIMINVVDGLQALLGISLDKSLYGILEELPIDQSKDFVHILIPDVLSSVRDHLVEKTLSIS
jgi:hypothetical protein